MGNAPYKMLFTEDPDMPLSIDQPHYKKLVKSKEELTGWQRLGLLFEPDEYGLPSPELSNCKDVMTMSMFFGGMLGGFARSRQAYTDFFRSYAHEAFETPMRAKMLLQEKVLIAFGTGFWRVGWRMTIFTGLFMFGTTCSTAYRGKYGIRDHVAGGALAGCLYKFREGPKASISGALLGTALGAIAGVFAKSLFTISGVNYDTFVAFEYQRRTLVNQNITKKFREEREHADRPNSLSEFQDSLMKEENRTKSGPDTNESSLTQVSTIQTINSTNNTS